MVCAKRQGRASALPSLVARLALPVFLDAVPDELCERIASALAAVDSRGLPVKTIIGDDLVRYFMVTPPTGCGRLLDLRGAADARFQALYGESVEPWQLMADWRIGQPFLACAIPRRLIDALRQTVAAQRSTLVSLVPAFVVAWDRSHRDVSADSWVASLRGGTLTLGLIAGSGRPSLAAVRTIALQSDHLSPARLDEQIAHAALLEGLPPPASLHVHGLPCDELQEESSPAKEAGIEIHWHGSGDASRARSADGASSIDAPVQRGATI